MFTNSKFESHLIVQVVFVSQFSCLKIWSPHITWSYTKFDTLCYEHAILGKFRGREVMLAMMNLELALERATGYDLVRQKELI